MKQHLTSYRGEIKIKCQIQVLEINSLFFTILSFKLSATSKWNIFQQKDVNYKIISYDGWHIWLFFWESHTIAHRKKIFLYKIFDENYMEKKVMLQCFIAKHNCDWHYIFAGTLAELQWKEEYWILCWKIALQVQSKDGKCLRYFKR